MKNCRTKRVFLRIISLTLLISMLLPFACTAAGVEGVQGEDAEAAANLDLAVAQQDVEVSDGQNAEESSKIPVTGVSLNVQELTLTVGDEPWTLSADVQPDNATDRSVSWESDAPEPVRVENGVVTPLASGSANVTVTTADGGYTAVCHVVVAEAAPAAAPNPVTGISLDKTELTLTEGSAGEQLTLTVEPSDAAALNVLWTAENEEIATVENGLVRPISQGSTEIRVSTEDGAFSAICKVTVVPQSKTVPVTGVTLDPDTLTLPVGSAPQSLTAKVQPTDATNQNLIWESDKTEIVSVADGVVTPHSVGEATVTVKTEDGSFSASCHVVVTAVEIMKITLDQTELKLTLGGESKQLTATVEPENATEKTLLWTSSDPEIAMVENGLVTPIAVGQCQITAASQDGKNSAICNVTVEERVFNLESIRFGQAPKFVICPTGYSFSREQKEYTLYFASNKQFAFSITMGSMPKTLYYEVTSDASTSVKKGPLKENKSVSLAAINPLAYPAEGKCIQFTIKIGEKATPNGSFTEIYDEYRYTVHRLPALETLSVEDSSSKSLKLSPSFDNVAQNFNYIVTVPSGETNLKISATPTKGSTTKVYIGGTQTVDNKLDHYDVDLTQYTVDEDGNVTIPIRLVNGQEENTYNLVVGLPDYLPEITKQPENTTVEKGEKKPLSVSVATPEKGTLSYQWYVGSEYGGNYTSVQGATEASYTPPDTSTASKHMYKCRITNTVGVNKYTVETDGVLYTVNLTYVSRPVVLKEPGTFQVTKGIGYDETPTKSEYYVGEKLEAVYIGLNRPEVGTSYTCKWYYNLEDSNSLKTAVPLETTLTAGTWYATGELYYNGFQVTNGFEAGTYYLFCVTTAKDDTNPDNSNSVVSGTFRVVYAPVDLDLLKGSGSESDPYQISTVEELQYLQQWVNVDGRSFEGMNFKLMNDLTLPQDWTPIGCTKDGNINLQVGRNLNAFSGTLDGDGHTLTVAKGGLPLFGYVRGTKIKNLNIYGEEIAGYGLVNHFTGVGMSAETAVLLENIRLLSGSRTQKAGLLGVVFGMNIYAGCSAGYNAIIRNCTIESGVIVGYDKDQDGIGSIAGRFQGSIENCVSYATVYGTNYVGGLVGTLDNAMGLCSVSNSQFHGDVIASGNFVGGIVGGGYDRNDSAPNGTRPDILNCSADGSVSGNECVGGIFGGDWYVVQTWDNVSSSMTANRFTGKISGTKYVGGFAGYFNSLNKYDVISANTFSADCGADRAIGFVHYLDTNYPNPTLMEGTVLINTENGTSDCPEIIVTSSPPVYKMTWKKGHNRTDDPLKQTSGSTEENTCYQLTAAGSYKTQYAEGEELDLTGIELTAHWTDGTTTRVSLADVSVSGYNKNETGQQTVSISYGNAVLHIGVVVLPKSSKITVSVTVLGDSNHGETSTPHGLRMGGLVTWADEPNIEADTTETVWDVLKRVFAKHSMTFSASDNNQYNTVYISAVNGLGEFDNGKNSGWMYTVNGTHPEVGVSARYVKDGDVIIFHYTDDYTKEEGSMAPDEDTGTAAKVDELISQIGTVTYTAACKERIDAARKAYNALSDAEKQKVTKLSVLTMAEARYASLKKTDDQAQARNVISLIYKIVTPVTEQSKASIDAARKAYDALTADQKALVTNLSRLTDAEAAYAQLTATDADKKKAQAVIDKIKKLGDITLDSEKDIEAARKAYDALTDLQKKLVENYDVLTAAEAKLAMLKTLGKVSDPYVTTGDYMEKLGTPSVGAVGGEWMVIGLVRSGRTVPGADTYYQGAVQYIREAIDKQTGRLHKAKSTDNSRMILALTALGKDVTNVGGYNLLQGLSDLDYVKYQGNNGPIWALLALDSGNYPAPAGGTTTRQALIDEILRVQTSDGGWTVSGDKADSDMTGMALTALAPYYTKDLKVQEAIDKAIARLSEMQDEDGGYSTSYDGTTKIATSESISQVVTALSALGINADTDPRFVKNGNSAIDALLRYYVKGGGFKHIMDGELDGMATEQAYYALTAYYRFLSGKTNLYDMTDIIDMGGDSVEVPTEPTVPATTEPTEVETGFPWWILVICVVGGCGLGMVIAIVIIPKFGKFKKKD